MSAALTADRPKLAATTPLFSPFWLGRLRLPNRIVMAPLTRARADEHGVPSELAAEYYTQRAGAGLIISEATAVSRQGTGYDNWPGLYTAAQEAGWRKITDAVHAAGGRIFIQLFHAGRMSHPVFHDGGLPVGPSPIAAGPATEVYDGVHPFTRPRTLQAAELPGIATQFSAAAERALAAGFDGVEVHAGNGYLLDQFLRDGANQRDDQYELASGFFRPMFSGPIIAAGGHTAETGTARIQHHQADLIAYGQLFIANPDLPARFRLNAPLAWPQRGTFYGGGAAGYTDYPALDQPARQPHASRETQLSNELPA